MVSFTEDLLSETDILVASIAGLCFLVGVPVLFTLLSRMRDMSKRPVTRSFLTKSRWPLSLVLSLIVLHISNIDGSAGKLIAVLLIVSFTWFMLSLMSTVKAAVHQRYPVDHPDNLDERKVRTQYQYIHAVSSIVIVLIGISLVFLQFESLRIIGAGLLASAGIAALILVFTAQQTLSNLIAGFQIAFTQPFRIDDVVIVEGEWGKIEEIRLTYVVVRIWDQRRLVLPISYFINNPFQNWTRTTADIWGTVVLHVDYKVPVDEVREELKRIVEGTDLWDGNVVGLQVTDTSERTMTLRALVSAKNASEAWDLRCLVRERLIDYLQRNHPESLPRIRLEDDKTDSSS